MTGWPLKETKGEKVGQDLRRGGWSIRTAAARQLALERAAEEIAV